jgi:hypothetical protein
MKKVAAVLLAVGLVNTCAFGGMIDFVNTAPGTYDVMMTADMGGVDFVDLVIGGVAGDDPVPGPFVSWTWASPFGFEADPLFDVGFYDHDVFLSANNPSALDTPMMLGTLVVRDDGSNWNLIVDYDSDFTSQTGFQGTTEPLSGQIKVPEPATLGLLGLASLGFLRRRK